VPPYRVSGLFISWWVCRDFCGSYLLAAFTLGMPPNAATPTATFHAEVPVAGMAAQARYSLPAGSFSPTQRNASTCQRRASDVDAYARRVWLVGSGRRHIAAPAGGTNIQGL